MNRAAKFKRISGIEDMAAIARLHSVVLPQVERVKGRFQAAQVRAVRTGNAQRLAVRIVRANRVAVSLAKELDLQGIVVGIEVVSGEIDVAVTQVWTEVARVCVGWVGLAQQRADRR